jgi:F-type H+-transporting ATPase subunit epsilon
MSSTMKVDIVSAEANIFSGVATSLLITGELGELGIKPGHSQLLTRLKPGHVCVTLENGTQELFYVSGGFLEVQPDIVTVLADTADRAQNLDELAALEAQKHAQKLLHDTHADIDYATALAELAQATAQLEAIRLLKRNLQ